MFLTISLASFSISLIAFVGVLFLIFRPETTQKISFYLISFAAGTLLGAVFFNALPEAVEFMEEPSEVFIYVLLGFLFFMLLERLLIWYHCHGQEVCEIHRNRSTALILLGDAVHNFIDGIIIVLAFLADFTLGIVTTISVALHEIPQEIGDFSVLIYGGFGRFKAIFWNVAVAFTTVIGAVTFYLLSDVVNVNVFLGPALGLVAGGFIYIAAVDLIPEIHHDTRPKIMFITASLLLTGILSIFLIGKLLPH